MSEKRLLIGLFVLFAISSAFLIAQNIRGIDPDGKNWWSLAFTEPTNERSLSFTIINHTENPSFQYTVTRGTEILDAGEFSIPTGTSQSYSPKGEITPGRTTITVTHDDTEETIYRSL